MVGWLRRGVPEFASCVGACAWAAPEVGAQPGTHAPESLTPASLKTCTWLQKRVVFIPNLVPALASPMDSNTSISVHVPAAKEEEEGEAASTHAHPVAANLTG